MLLGVPRQPELPTLLIFSLESALITDLTERLTFFCHSFSWALG
jgi:hypothetical protein